MAGGSTEAEKGWPLPYASMNTRAPNGDGVRSSNSDPYQKVKRILSKIEKVPVSDFSYSSSWTMVKGGLHDPPIYMIKILLLNILGLQNLGPGEKTRWETQFRYEGKHFLIRDSKFGWAIESNASKETTASYADELYDRILRAVKALDTTLQPVLKKKVEAGDFYLKNEYGRLDSVFRFYEEKVAKSMNDLKLLDDEREAAAKEDGWDMSRDIELLNRHFHYLSEISNYSFGMILAFFSLQDCMLDSFYAFERDGEGLLEFTNGDRWNEKFKEVFGIPSELAGIYNELLRARKTYRNALTHGLAGEPRLMVQMSGVGLVPITIEHLDGTPHYGLSMVEENEAASMKDIFNKFLRYISENNPWRYYLLYLETGFPIPAIKPELDEIKSRMKDYDEFKSQLEDEVINAEAFANYDIS